MTEEEARAWLDAKGYWRGVQGDRLRLFVDLLLRESDRQNLISSGSRSQLWSRHVVDSAQLLSLAPAADGSPWVDLGTGAGFPGMVVACLRDGPVTLIEARPLRATFLQRCVDALELDKIKVISSKVERARCDKPALVISARAFAPLDRLLAGAHHLSDENTVWLLPKGRNGEKELEIIRRDWQAMFHVEQSITDPESVIVTIQQLRGRTAATRPHATAPQASLQRSRRPRR